jgi:hypothetical protein
LAEAAPDRYLVLDGTRPLAGLAADISARVLGLLPAVDSAERATPDLAEAASDSV